MSTKSTGWKNFNLKRSILRILFAKSIRREFFILLMLAAAIPLLFTGCFSYVYLSHSAKNEFKNNSDIILKHLSLNIDQFLGKTEAVSLMALNDANVQQVLEDSITGRRGDGIANVRTIEQFIRNMNVLLDNVSGIYIFSSNKVFYYYQYDALGMDYGYLFNTQDWYKKTIEKDGAKVLFGTHKPFQRKNSNEHVISISRAIKKIYTDDIIGVILIDIKLDKIEDICSKTNKSNQNVIIMDENGGIIFSSEGFKPADILNSDKSESEDTLDTDKSKSAGILNMDESTLSLILNNQKGNSVANIAGNKSYLNFTTSDYSGWKVIQYVPYGEILKASRLTGSFILIFAGFSLLIAVMLSYTITKSLSKPIIGLSNALERVGAGDFSCDIESSRDDEIGKLQKGFNSMVQDLKKLIQRVSQAKVKKKEAELNALQSQMNPHFLYNTLQSIQMKAVVNDQRDIADMVGTLGALLKINTGKGSDIVTLQQELNHVNLYLKIQKIRYGDKLEYTQTIPAEYLSYYTVRFILQPLVENALCHGIEELSQKAEVRLTAGVENDMLVIRVIDTGIGMSSEKLNEIKSILKSDIYSPNLENVGIKNVNDRIKLYFGEQYGLDIESEKNRGTTVYVRIPLIRNKDEIDINNLLA